MNKDYRKYRKEFIDELNLISIKNGWGTSLEDALKNGVSVLDFEKFSKELNNSLSKKFNLKESHFAVRPIINEYIIKLFGSTYAFVHSEVYNKRRLAKIQNTCIKHFGVKNPGMLEEHKNNMRYINGVTKNPFATLDFKYKEYVKGKRCKPGNEVAYANYDLLVRNETQKHIKEIPFTGKCYYTGMPIIKFEKGKTNPNDENLASIDHKESILSGFLRKADPKEIGGVNNLCWTSRHFNSFKGSKSEIELRLSGIIERYKECYCKEIRNENKNN